MSGIQPPDCSKLTKNPKNGNDVTILWHDVKDKYFSRCFVFLVKFSYWSKFHVNIITGSGIMTIFFYKGLTRNPEIGNTPSEFCPISGDWCKLWIPNLERMSLIECCWMLQNSRVTAFTVFEKLLRENYYEGDGVKLPHPSLRLGLRKGVVILYSKFAGEHSCGSAISTKLLCKYYWNCTTAWVFSGKFVA